MSKITLLMRFIFFCLFFAVGAGSMTLSFIAPELLENYKSIDQLGRTRRNNEKLEKLIAIYDNQIEMTKTDPEILKRLEQKTFGTENPPDNASYPHASEALVRLARIALKETESHTPVPSKLRIYIERAAKQRNRYGLLYSGAALIIISFLFFGTPKKSKL